MIFLWGRIHAVASYAPWNVVNWNWPTCATFYVSALTLSVTISTRTRAWMKPGEALDYHLMLCGFLFHRWTQHLEYITHQIITKHLGTLSRLYKTRSKHCSTPSTNMLFAVLYRFNHSFSQQVWCSAAKPSRIGAGFTFTVYIVLKCLHD